jgi:hypothetical protein
MGYHLSIVDCRVSNLFIMKTSRAKIKARNKLRNIENGKIENSDKHINYT